MRIALLAAVAALVGCGGSQSIGNGGSAGGGMPGMGGSDGNAGGGMPGMGGSAGNAGGTEPTDCGTSVTFRLPGLDASSESSLCLGQPGSCLGSSWEVWPAMYVGMVRGFGGLQVFDEAGQEVSLAPPSCSSMPCSVCVGGCPAVCRQSIPLPAEGVTREWNGMRWTGGQTCTSAGGSQMECMTPACAAPGSYTARFCAYELSGSGGVDDDPTIPNQCELKAATTPTCVDVPFELPGASMVEGVIPPEF